MCWSCGNIVVNRASIDAQAWLPSPTTVYAITLFTFAELSPQKFQVVCTLTRGCRLGGHNTITTDGTGDHA